MHLLACKGVLSATPNAKDMTSDAWDCLGTRILGPYGWDRMILWREWRDFSQKGHVWGWLKGLRKIPSTRENWHPLTFPREGTMKKIPSKVFRFSYIITFFPIVLADLLTFLGPKKNPKWLNDATTTMNLQQLQLKIPQKQQHQIQNLQNLSTQQC